MADLTPAEQLMLELVNRARLDPGAEAKRLGIKLNEGVPKSDKISVDSKQVLAANDLLIDAARSHSKWMNDNDAFSHFQGNKGPTDRMRDAGYVFSGSFASGENIAARFQSAPITDAQTARLIVQSYRDLFIDKGIENRGHRTNILSDMFQEIGIGQDIGKYRDGGTNWNSSMVTQDFARSGSSVFVTGVVYNDTVKKDDFFTVGEQRAGVSVRGNGVEDTTGAGGGYELRYDSGGPKDIVFANGVTVSIALANRNVKVDLVNGNEIWTSTSITAASTQVKEIHALGKDNIDLAGSASAEAIYGNRGKNILSGGGGDDSLIGGRGIDKLFGGAGADTFVFAKGDTGKTAAKADTIADFSTADGDVIDLHAWDANSKASGNQDFTFIGTDSFHRKAGELRAFADGGETIIQGDTNGDGKADLVIRLEGNITLTGDSFDL